MISKLVKENRSCRRFYEDQAVAPEALKELVDLARMSASGENLQPLKYILSCHPSKNADIFSCLAWAAYLKDWPGPGPEERPAAVSGQFYPAEPGLQVSTVSKRVRETRRTLLELYLARCPDSEEIRAVARAEGAYALVVMTKREPRKIVAVRKISPLVIGLGEGETYLASDIPALLHQTRAFIIIEDDELVTLTEEGAGLLHRLVDAGARPRVKLMMNARNLDYLAGAVANVL